MKNVLFVFLAVGLFFASCSKEEDTIVSSKRVINFQKTVYEDDMFGTRGELIEIEVEIVKKDGRPQMISDQLVEKELVRDGETIYMYSYKNAEIISSSGSRIPLNFGYIFDGGNCFVYCAYYETTDGGVLPLTCCGDTPGNCVGLDPICAGPGEAWA